jgi:CRISPR-associated protein Csb2
MPLAFQVRLRHGRYDAGGLDPGRPEWPPHPARVFCALAASAQSSQDWDALRWLERSGSPQVWADASASTGRGSSFVVTNQAEAGGGSQFWPGRTNGLRSRAWATPAVGEFAIVWPHADAEDDVLARLQRMARTVPYVGRSTSQAEVTASRQPPQERPLWRRWAPSRIGVAQAVELRVPYPGYVDALRDTYQTGGRAWEVARSVSYALLIEQPAPKEPAVSAWDDLMIWGFERPSVRIGGDQVLTLTATLRKAVLKSIGVDIPPQVSGHGADDRPHVGFLALPDVGHPHADGHLLGLALALPRAMPAEDWKRLVQAVVGPLTSITPWPGRAVALRYGADPRRRTLTIESWRGPKSGTRCWVTATPLVTDGRMRQRRSVEELVLKSLTRAGYPEPAELEVSTAPLTTGAVRGPRRGTLPQGRPDRPMAHVRVRFTRPVVGPVMAGSLRYLGLGLFVPDGTAR